MKGRSNSDTGGLPGGSNSPAILDLDRLLSQLPQSVIQKTVTSISARLYFLVDSLDTSSGELVYSLFHLPPNLLDRGT